MKKILIILLVATSAASAQSNSERIAILEKKATATTKSITTLTSTTAAQDKTIAALTLSLKGKSDTLAWLAKVIIEMQQENTILKAKMVGLDTTLASANASIKVLYGIAASLKTQLVTAYSLIEGQGQKLVALNTDLIGVRTTATEAWIKSDDITQFTSDKKYFSLPAPTNRVSQLTLSTSLIEFLKSLGYE